MKKHRQPSFPYQAQILNAEVPDPVIKYAPLLVNPNDPEIKKLAVSLGGPEEIYLFVRDKIEYSESYDKRRTVSEVLESGRGDCPGQADLLAALLANTRIYIRFMIFSHTEELL